MDNEQRRDPMLPEVRADLEKRNLSLVAVWKVTEPDVLVYIERLVNAFGVYMTPGSYDMEIGAVREWLLKMRLLDRHGMR